MQVVRKRQGGGLETLEVGEASDPGTPRAGEILVKLGASSINFHDYAVARGMIRVEDGRIPMSDGAGRVLAVGEGVTEFAPGDAVISTFFPDWQDGAPLGGDFRFVPGEGVDGFACGIACAAATAFTRAPKGYSEAEAATLPCAGLTAWRSLVVEGRLQAGQTVLVQGTGGVSIFALQFAKAMGARVVATSSSDEKLERLTALGADHVINYKTEANWGDAANVWSDGGVDQVVEIGGSGTLPQSIAAVRPGGTIGLIGVLAGVYGNVPTMLLMQKQIRLIGITVGTRRSQRDMVAAIEANDIRPVIDSAFPLASLADAFRYQETGAHFGKIVIDI